MDVPTLPTASFAGTGVEAVCAQIWKKSKGDRSDERKPEQPYGAGRDDVIIQAELRRKQSGCEANPCAVATWILRNTVRTAWKATA